MEKEEIVGLRRDPHWSASVCPETGEPFKVEQFRENTLGDYGHMSGREGLVSKCASCGKEIAFTGIES